MGLSFFQHSLCYCKQSEPKCSTYPLSVCLYIYIYRMSVIFGSAEAITLRENVSQLIESSKVTYGTDIEPWHARPVSTCDV